MNTDKLIKELELLADSCDSNYALEINGYSQGVNDAIDLVKKLTIHDVSNCSQECEWKADTFDNIGMALTEYCEECGAKRDCC